jgi:hypothetical protein
MGEALPFRGAATAAMGAATIEKRRQIRNSIFNSLFFNGVFLAERSGEFAE